MKNINWGRVVEVFNSVSTTSVRIYFTLIVIAWTAWDYIIQDDTPNSDWLLFLATLAGVDMIQAAVKTAATSRVRTHEVTANKETAVKTLELEHKKLSVRDGQIIEEPTTEDETEKEKG